MKEASSPVRTHCGNDCSATARNSAAARIRSVDRRRAALSLSRSAGPRWLVSGKLPVRTPEEGGHHPPTHHQVGGTSSGGHPESQIWSRPSHAQSHSQSRPITSSRTPSHAAVTHAVTHPVMPSHAWSFHNCLLLTSGGGHPSRKEAWPAAAAVAPRSCRAPPAPSPATLASGGRGQRGWVREPTL